MQPIQCALNSLTHWLLEEVAATFQVDFSDSFCELIS